MGYAEITSLYLVKLTNPSSSSILPTISVAFSVSISENFRWTLTVKEHIVVHDEVATLVDEPDLLRSSWEVVHLLNTLDSSKFCIGNSEDQFVTYVHDRKGIIKTLSGVFNILYIALC